MFQFLVSIVPETYAIIFCSANCTIVLTSVSMPEVPELIVLSSHHRLQYALPTYEVLLIYSVLYAMFPPQFVHYLVRR